MRIGVQTLELGEMKLVGYFSLVDGAVEFEDLSNGKHSVLIERLLSWRTFNPFEGEDGTYYEREADPKRWLENLPNTYHGTALSCFEEP